MGCNTGDENELYEGFELLPIHIRKRRTRRVSADRRGRTAPRSRSEAKGFEEHSPVWAPIARRCEAPPVATLGGSRPLEGRDG